MPVSRIKTFTISCATVLLTTGAIATHATTPEAYRTAETHHTVISPYAQMSDGKQVLMFLSQAQSLVYKGDSTFAKMHINEALNATSRLSSSSAARAQQDIHRVTLLHLRDGTVKRQLLLVQPEGLTVPLDFPADAVPTDQYRIAKAEVHYLKPEWDKEQLLVALNRVLRGIEKGKAVSSEFTTVHDILLKSSHHAISDRHAAQDHIALARALIRVQAYRSAREAIAQADSHIERLANDKSQPKRFEDIAAMRNEMATVNTAIERNEPGAFKGLDEKLAKWWDVLS